MAVAGNLARNVNILETRCIYLHTYVFPCIFFGFGGYLNYKFSFDYILVINKLGKK